MIAGRKDRLRAAEEKAAHLEKVVEARDRTIAALQAQLEVLRAELADLREQLGKNSRNSGKPPSSDSPEARESRPKGEPSGRKSGGQLGHKGHYRELVPADRVTRVADHRPAACSCCGKPLPQTEGEPVERHQVVEIPPITPSVTEHRAYEEVCSNCRTITRAPFPAEVPSGALGPRLVSLVALLTGAYRLSKRNAQNLLETVLDVRFSLGTLSKTEERISAALSEPVDQALRHVQEQPIKNCDATSWRTSNQRRQIWVIASALVSVFCITVNGTAETLRGLLRTVTGVLITDRASVFTFWSKRCRQVCWAHLIRAFQAFQLRTGAAAQVGADLLAETQIIMALWRRVRDGTLQRSSFKTYIQDPRARMRKALERGIICGHTKTEGTCRKILQLFDAMWTFARVDGVEPTNNRAERDLRHSVIWRRTSHGTQSVRGDRFVERIMTVVATLKLQRRNILEYLEAAYLAHLTRTTPPSLLPPEPVDPKHSWRRRASEGDQLAYKRSSNASGIGLAPSIAT